MKIAIQEIVIDVPGLDWKLNLKTKFGKIQIIVYRFTNLINYE